MYRSRTVFIFLLCILQIFGDSVPTTHEHEHPNATVVKNNSSHLQSTSRDSKSIQSVPLIADLPLEKAKSIDNFTSIVRLQDVLRVFDITELARKWHVIKGDFKSQCTTDMTKYLRGLKHHNLWATKSKCLIFAVHFISFCFFQFFFFCGLGNNQW